jgi:hypothetical protein
MVVVYLLSTVPLTVWEHVALGVALLQYGSLLALLLTVGWLWAGVVRKRAAVHPASGLRQRIISWLLGLMRGLGTAISGGRRIAPLALLLSLAGTALTIFRLELLLGAFGLHGTIPQVLMLLILTDMVGRLPIHIPGGRVWASSGLLHVTGIGGASVGAYVIADAAMRTLEAPILAGVVVAGAHVFLEKPPLQGKDLMSAVTQLRQHMRARPVDKSIGHGDRAHAHGANDAS